MNDEALYDAQLIITYPAESEEHAMQVLDDLLDELDERGYTLGPASVEESVKLTYE